MKLSEIAKLVSGSVRGEASTEVENVAMIEAAREGDLVFVLDKNFLAAADKSSASAMVCSSDQKSKKPAICVDSPRTAMAKILSHFSGRPKPRPGVHPSAVVEKSARIAKDASIGAFVYVGEKAEIGSGSVIYPNAVIYDNVVIGKNVIIHSGAVIGMEGFGFVPTKEAPVKVPQIGKVVIEDDVEIYGGTMVARATLGETRICRGAKIDNMGQVAHNCRIGKNCLIAGKAGLSGSVTLGNNVIVAGEVGFKDHVKVGDNCVILARAGVTKDLAPGSVVSGYPAQDHKTELRRQAKLRKLLNEK